MKTIIVFTLCLASFVCVAQDSGQNPNTAIAQLETNMLPARGKQSTILNIQKFGRYAVLVESDQGTALQCIDRMAGPGDIAGRTGEQDGRLDLFLDRGDYKIITHAHENGNGDSTLSVHNFTELHAENIPQLVKLKTIALSLEDFQQRSFWLNIETPQTVAIEAAGRSLADLRLWKDGSWLIDIAPVAKPIDPHPDKPLQAMQINTKLQPGLYLLTAYGGPARAWTEQSDEHPLYIRYGIPRLPEAGQRRYTVSPFGSDRYIVPGNSNYFYLSVPEATSIAITADTYREDNAFSTLGRTARITKKNIPPVAELEMTTQRSDRLVTVTAMAGQSYILQHFEKRWRYSINDTGRYWLSSIHSGSAEDSVDATSILTRRPWYETEQFMDARVITLSRKQRYQRRFNLLDTLTLYLEVPERGKYIIKGQGEGVRAKYRVEPFLTSRPRDYEPPPFEDSGYKWDLDAGYYILTVRPELKGIITLTAEKEGYLRLRDNSAASVSGATRYGVVDIQRNYYYTLYLNRQPGVKAGVVLRRVPVDLSAALPVMQRGNEIVTIPVKIPEAGSVRAFTIDGKALPLSLIGGRENTAWKDRLDLARGDYTLSVRNPGSDTINYSLEFAATRLSKTASLPPLPPELSESLPNFPELTELKSEYFDLDRDQPTTLAVTVDQSALYRLETGGLLETQGTLRTRTNPLLVRQQTNGVGRNFLIQQYLREGDYQLTVQPRHQSRGHIGVNLNRTTIEDGGRLSTDVAARATLKAGKGLLYQFNIARKGKYRVRAIGAGRTYVMRLEDADGWPIEPPNIPADISREFDAGNYRMIIRPEAVDARVVTTLQGLAEPVRFQGHGPHAIALGHDVEHEWREPQAGQPRSPDIWTFRLPAAAEVNITLTDNMRGELFLHDNPNHTALATVTPAKSWQGKLEAGKYQLEVKNLRGNNLVNYQLKVTSKQLLIGHQRNVVLPASIPISVGRDNLIELWSYGQVDVRARLYDHNGNLVARGDDRSNDWNFLIAQKLAMGDYRLEVEPVGGNSQSTKSNTVLVSMRSPKVRYGNTQSLPFNTTITDTDAHVYPLQLSGKASLVVVQAQCDDAVGVSVEVTKPGALLPNKWKELASHRSKNARLLIPIDRTDTQSYRLRVWSLDRRGAPIAVLAQTVELSTFDELALSKSGISLRPVAGPGNSKSSLAVAAIKPTHPGVFRTLESEKVLWSSQPNQPLSGTYNGLMTATGRTLWIARPITKDSKVAKLMVKRLVLNDLDGDKKTGGTVQLQVPPWQTSRLDIKGMAQPLLVIAESRTGQAGVLLANRNNAKPELQDLQRFSVAKQSAVSVLLRPHDPIAKIWNAGAQSDALEVSVKPITFALDQAKTISAGEYQQALASSTAVPLTLPPGLKRFSLVLPAETAAVLMQEDTVVSTHWSGKTPLNEVTFSWADKILVFNAGGITQHFALSIESISQMNSTGPEITAGTLFKQPMHNTGQLRIPVTAQSDNAMLRIRGTAQGTLIQSNGQVSRGTDLPIQTSGELILEHQPGVVYAWLDSRSRKLSKNPVPLLDVTSPQTIPLQGASSAFQVDTKQGMQLQLRSETPLISRVVYADGSERVEAHPHGLNYAVYLPAGPSRIELESLGSSAMNGHAMVSTLPIVPIKEGYGPESILSGGETRMYGFEVKQQGPLGLGVQASADVVSGILMDSTANIISRGVVHMPELPPGHYVFAVTVPADSRPVRIRPALVGLERPPSGPPKDVIQHYLQQAGRKLAPQFAQ
jgi:hypothetical protein